MDEKENRFYKTAEEEHPQIYVAGSKLTTALIKAQAAMTPPKLNQTNQWGGKYADLASIIEAVKKPLNDSGICFTQTTLLREDGFVLLTVLRHESGETLISEWPLPLTGTEQQRGSALTYAKRYSLASITGVAAEEDDDAEAASKIAPKRQTAAERDATKPQAKAPEQKTEKLKPHWIERPEGSTATEWATKFTGQIALCTSEEEIAEWHKANSETLVQLHEHAPKVDERVIAFVTARKAALKKKPEGDNYDRDA